MEFTNLNIHWFFKQPPTKQTVQLHFWTKSFQSALHGSGTEPIQETLLTQVNEFILFEVKNTVLKGQYKDEIDWTPTQERLLNNAKRKRVKKLLYILEDSTEQLGCRLVGQLTKQGKRQRFFNSFFFFYRMWALSHANSFLEELEELITEDTQLPFDLGKRHSSSRIYLFPQPRSAYTDSRFFHRQLTTRIRQKKKNGTFFTGFSEELLLLLQDVPQSFIFSALNEYILLGFKNRMFIHYRWRR